MYSKVLVPIMGKYSKNLVESTLDLIDGRDVELIALYVVDNSVPFLTPKTIKETMVIELKAKGEIFLNEFEELIDLEKNKNISLRKELIEGKPAELIVKIAEDNCVDVIVMGTGKSIVDKHLLGSVSEEVVHFAPCTIHLVRTIDKTTCDIK
ncbi:universal stress protein [Methanobrevibacter sp. TMH8]|uniref:universal stress protein n=1 Tax=Methanobrevibacter sp. TMH8 TaxID=2848611 RepID=UPI001CCF061C|nr:universal stress protein [Methanobrevibacter sp. TMH8]MBZ9570300.1 universal stress protein [Methanobrevibacter sp. TMH8]